tara:strand:+ start:14708 stop:15208 length:501 start_codon:yes stop_codon:yes gene_type:complete
MFYIIITAFIINLIFFTVYLKIYNKNLFFFRYFKSFLVFSLFLSSACLFVKSYNLILFEFTSREIIIFLTVYSLFFISFFLTTPLKFIDSPTYLMYEKIIKNKSCSREMLSKYLKNKRVIDIRIRDLKRQGIIIEDSENLRLKKKFNFTISLIFFFKRIFKLKSEG